MSRSRSLVRPAAFAAGAVALLVPAACSTGSNGVSGTATSAAAVASSSSSASGGASTPAAAGGCPSVVAADTKAVAAASSVSAAWTGPTTGPKAVKDKTIVYVAQDLTNPGIAGVAKGIQEAGKVLGWTVKVVDGQGSTAGISSAFSQAIAVKPAGIVIGGFDPNSTSAQVKQANAAGITLIGWHAVNNPGPSTSPKLFTNVTSNVSDVAKISAEYIIAKSNGTAGVVVFTDKSIPFAAGKSAMLTTDLQTCSSVTVLTTENIPISDAATRTPQAVSGLVSQYGKKWTWSVAINDLYFDSAAPSLRAAGLSGAGAPFNVGAGDGSPAAFQRIRAKQYQTATIPEPLNEQGWQVVDEFNRAFSGQPASGFVAKAHITDASNVGTQTSYDPQNGYRQKYEAIWGVSG
jgi:ribose transport system substrate-binding protein